MINQQVIKYMWKIQNNEQQLAIQNKELSASKIVEAQKAEEFPAKIMADQNSLKLIDPVSNSVRMFQMLFTIFTQPPSLKTKCDRIDDCFRIVKTLFKSANSVAHIKLFITKVIPFTSLLIKTAKLFP